ncbi:MAG: flagellar protein FlgN [Oscillospiraceae bacterium]|jgi:flagellar biosynthesis/type III secretory pathway chaperone|nr:flagellar protein FlgN [Oscillospiraceae bacterium]
MQILNNFCEVLSDERALHADLLALSTQKKDAITKNDVTALDNIVKGEELLLARLNNLERLRRECVSELAAELGRPAEEIVLRDFLSVSPPEQREQLTGLHRELRSLLERQIGINEINKRLIESRLEYIHYTMEAVVGGDAVPYQTYGAGREAARPTRKTTIIDQKV